MSFPNATKEATVIAARNGFGFASIHTAAAGTSGAAEASGGSPAYARKAITWTDGGVDGNTTGSTVTFDLPAGTYVEIGFWSAATGGTFGGSIALGSAFSPTGQATLQVTPTLTVA